MEKSLEDEFALAQLFIQARADARLTQAELAERMKTSQACVARLGSGKEKPSTPTLTRFANATGHRVVIQFERLSAQGERRRFCQQLISGLALIRQAHERN